MFGGQEVDTRKTSIAGEVISRGKTDGKLAMRKTTTAAAMEISRLYI
jgi:hypothetical protein